MNLRGPQIPIPLPTSLPVPHLLPLPCESTYFPAAQPCVGCGVKRRSVESVQSARSYRAHSRPLASHAMTRRHGDAGQLNGLMEGAGDLGKSGSTVALLAASSRAASWPSSPRSRCIGLLHEAVRFSAWPKMSCSTGTSGSSYRRSTCNGSYPLPQQWALHTTRGSSGCASSPRA